MRIENTFGCFFSDSVQEGVQRKTDMRNGAFLKPLVEPILFGFLDPPAGEAEPDSAEEPPTPKYWILAQIEKAVKTCNACACYPLFSGSSPPEKNL